MQKLTLKIDNLDCMCVADNLSDRITYILSPYDSLADWIERAATRYNTSIVVITGMDWDNDLTPWPAKGVPSGSPDFEGNAPQFQKTLKEVAAIVEKRLSISVGVTRDLVGVSLSGLFTLWQWTKSDLFRNIASLSGSFWYDGFVKWFANQNLSTKTGFAYFLLGDKEPYSNVKEFRSVGVDTQEVVDRIKAQGVRVQYDTVPGNHFQFPMQRLDRAMHALSF